jgi:secreted trypsin-like serine protease
MKSLFVSRVSQKTSFLLAFFQFALLSCRTDVPKDTPETRSRKAQLFQKSIDYAFSQNLSVRLNPKNSKDSFGIVGGVDVSETNSILPLITVRIDILNQGGTASFCTGTIVGQRFVVSAAHCFAKYFEPVTLNPSIDVSFGSGASVSRRVKKLTYHDGFAKSTQYPKMGKTPGYPEAPLNDVALLELQDEIPSSSIPIGILPSSIKLNENQVIKIAGFGKTDDKAFSQVLRATQMYLHQTKETAKVIGAVNSDSQSACNGDSGGPALVVVSDFLYLVGATSYGSKHCADGSVVFTDLRLFHGWLNEKAIQN